MKNKFSYVFITIVISIVCSIVLTSGGAGEGTSTNGAAGEGSKDDVSTIVFWTDQTQAERLAQIQLLMDTFEALNPQYKVELAAVDINEFTQQFNTASSSGTLPNLLHTTTQFLLSYDEEGLVDTEATGAVIDKLGKDKFYNGAANISRSVSNNGYFMVPYHFMVQGIWYRKDWFAEAGLSPPNTRDSLLAAAKHFYKPDQNQYGLLVGTKAQEQYNEQILLQLATAHNAYLFDKQGKLAIDSPEMLDALEYYKELSQYTPPGPQTWRSRDYYLQGKLAMFFYSSFIMDDLAIQEVAANSLTSENFEELQGADFDRNLVENTGFVSGFKWDVESTYAEINGLSILKNTNNKAVEGTKKLIEFLFERDNYITWVHIVPGGMFPVFEEVINSEEFINDPKGVYKRYGQNKIKDLAAGINNPKAFIIRDGVVYPDAASVASKKIIPDLIYSITETDTPITQAVADAKKKIEELLAE